MPVDREARVQEILSELRDDPSLLDRRFRRIHDLYVSTLHHFFSKRGFAPGHCQDLTQETFLSIYKGIPSFRGESRFDTWLFKVATHVHWLHLRKWGTQKRSGQEVSLTASGEEDDFGLDDLIEDGRPRAEEALLDRERSQRLRQAVDELPEKMRKCVVMKIYNEMSSREIAAVLLISEETVKAHLHQATIRLRKRLSEG
jgi:RNA polymerase sigma-70 factor, ECF subfamily